MELRKTRQYGEIIKGHVLRDAIQRSLGEKIHREQHSSKERDKRQCKFPEKVTPHVSRTNTQRRARSSGGWDFPDRSRFFRVGGGHRRPRCAASRSDRCPKRHPEADPA